MRGFVLILFFTIGGPLSFANDLCVRYFENKLPLHDRLYGQATVERVSLSSESGIYLTPKKISKKIEATAILGDVSRPWNLDEFRLERAPTRIGEIQKSILDQRVGLRVLDLPIRLKGSVDDYRIPRELEPYLPLIQEIIDIEHTLFPPEVIRQYHTYITIDQAYLNEGQYMRRPGAHVDGFQGASMKEKLPINHSYIVSNLTPTVFYRQAFDFRHLTDGRHDFFIEMDRFADDASAISTEHYNLYLMSAYNVHRADRAERSGLRTFIRISYDAMDFVREGNTWNPLFGRPTWTYTSRQDRDLFEAYQPNEANPSAIIDYVASLPEVKVYSNHPSYNWVLREHSRTVVENLMIYIEGSPHLQQYERLLKYVGVVHDLEKVMTLNKSDLKQFVPRRLDVARSILRKMLFSKEEIEIAISLIDHDVIGDYLKGKVSAVEAAETLRVRAQRSGLDLQVFMNLQLAFYISDAAAYPQLRQRILVQEGDQLRLKLDLEQKIQELFITN